MLGSAALQALALIHCLIPPSRRPALSKAPSNEAKDNTGFPRPRATQYTTITSGGQMADEDCRPAPVVSVQGSLGIWGWELAA